MKLVVNTGRAVATVARELGVNEATLGRWVNALKARHDAGDGALSETERAQLARLRKENSELKMDRALLEKRHSSRPGSVGYEREAFALMHAESNFSIARMARLLEVSRAGYYAWLDRARSARGLPADRIAAESFFATLKTESHYRCAWPTQAPAKVEIAPWIKGRYNGRRRHSALGQNSPIQFEIEHCSQRAADLQSA